MLTILHLSFDYAESQDGPVTSAIGQLVEQTRKFSRSQVISFDRVMRKNEETVRSISPEHLNIKSFRLRYGLFLLSHLKHSFKKVLKADSTGLINLNAVDVVHAHKLTFEGYIGYLLAVRYDIPLFVSLRQTDFMVLKYRPDLHRSIKNVLRRSERIFYIAPYMINSIKKRLGDEFFEKHIEKKLVFLPNIIEREMEDADSVSPKKSLLTVLRMTKRSAKRKNIKNLFEGLEMYAGRDFQLNVIGGGDYLEVVKGWAEKSNICGKINFLGAVSNREIDRHYARALAFLMPSYSETFGNAYAEALLNGTPILYSRGTGFDGMFEKVGVAVEPGSCREIGEGVMDLIDNNRIYRTSIDELKRKNAFHIFQPEYARETYQKCINKLF